jgi:hypothetical protein
MLTPFNLVINIQTLLLDFDRQAFKFSNITQAQGTLVRQCLDVYSISLYKERNFLSLFLTHNQINRF